MGPKPGPGLRQPGRVTLGGQSQKPAHGTGFRRFDLRDEFSGLRRRGTERREAFGGLGTEKGTFLGSPPTLPRVLLISRCSAVVLTHQHVQIG
jgi:hypothetical protein